MRAALACAAIGALLAACAGLAPPAEAPSTYLLEPRGSASRIAQRDLVLALGGPRARPGFDTPRMAYVRRAHELEYFAKSRWADAPARMIAPLLAQAIEQSGAVRAVVQGAGVAQADLRLEVELVRLLQDFTVRPSRVRLTVRAQIVGGAPGRVVATREFDESEEAPAEDAYGGVVAANRALERLLGRLAGFVAEQPARP
jgi:cholesterol transport system auxiliary component